MTKLSDDDAVCCRRLRAPQAAALREVAVRAGAVYAALQRPPCSPR